jgi:hypothetical protein
MQQKKKYIYIYVKNAKNIKVFFIQCKNTQNYFFSNIFEGRVGITPLPICYYWNQTVIDVYAFE